jgi:hypothetical protein
MKNSGPNQHLRDFKFLKKIKTLFNIAAMKCHCCEELSTERSDGATPQDFGINNLEQWEEIMQEHMTWAFENKKDVLRLLKKLDKSWGGSCDALRIQLNGCEHY